MRGTLNTPFTRLQTGCLRDVGLKGPLCNEAGVKRSRTN